MGKKVTKPKVKDEGKKPSPSPVKKTEYKPLFRNI